MFEKVSMTSLLTLLNLQQAMCPVAPVFVLDIEL